MCNKRITLINTWKPHVSLYIYSRLLSSVSSDIAILDLTEEITGKGVIKDLKSFILTFTGINLFYKIKNENSIIHYIDPAIAPLNNESTSVVTIWDNPSVVLNTDLYMNNYLMKIHFKGNMKRFLNFQNVITPTNYIKNALEEYGFEGDIKSIFFPVRNTFKQLQDKIEIRKDLGLPLEKKLILSVSVDTKRKNLEMVKRVSQKLDDSYKIVRVGMPINDSITFIGVNDETLVKIYNACDLLLMPSLEEGQGVPISEAFKVGLPVVASDIPVFREVAGNAAIFIDPKDETSIIRGIRVRNEIFISLYGCSNQAFSF